MAKIAVLGAGSWGSAQANHLRKAGHEVVLWGWGPDCEILRELAAHRVHKFFPGITFAEGIQVTDDICKAVQDRDIVVMAVPSQAMRSVAHSISETLDRHTVVLNTAKGLEQVTLCRMSEVLYQELGYLERLTVLSGPSFAREVAAGLPTAVTVAGYTRQAIEAVKNAYHHGRMRIYTSNDIIGVELGGTLKNIIALATGIVDGCGMGDNCRAALLTRALVEMSRLVVALGGQEATMQGLSGLGDMILTSTGDQSRNRQVGLRLGAGESLQDILHSMEQVAEGVYTARSGMELAKANNVDCPIIAETNMVLEGQHTVQEAVQVLFARSPKKEH